MSTLLGWIPEPAGHLDERCIDYRPFQRWRKYKQRFPIFPKALQHSKDSDEKGMM